MSNYPAFASYFLRSFSGVSTANFRVPPQAGGEKVAHNQIDFVLPTNTLIKMNDIRLVFTASAVANGTSAAPRLPPADAFLERVQVSMGGISVDSGCASTNVLSQVKRNYRHKQDDPVNSHVNLYRNVMGFNLKQLAAAAEAYTKDGESTIFSIPLGSFFETIQPSLLDVSLLPEIRITLFLAGNTVITSGTTGNTTGGMTGAGNAQATYTLNNYNLLVPCYSIDDGVYSEVIQSRMNDEGFLEASWCGYDSYQDTFSGTTRVASAASSLDRIISVFRSSTFSGINGAKAIAGQNNGRLTSLTEADILGQVDCNGGDKYLPAPLNFTAPMTNLPSNANPDKLSEEPKISVSINNIRYPQYDCPLSQWYVLSAQAMDVARTASESYIEYLTNRCQIVTRLNLPGSQGMRAKSGLDLRGSNSSILVSSVGNVTNFANTGNIVVFLESTRVLRIGQGKTLQIVL
jgi:hypothetical protein